MLGVAQVSPVASHRSSLEKVEVGKRLLLGDGFHVMITRWRVYRRHCMHAPEPPSRAEVMVIAGKFLRHNEQPPLDKEFRLMSRVSHSSILVLPASIDGGQSCGIWN